MKKLMTYVLVFILITASILLFLTRNFAPDIVEMSFNTIVDSSRIDRAIMNSPIYNYFNIYDVYARGENVSVYSGNINMLLSKSKIETVPLTYRDDEVIMGSKHMENNFKYNLLGERYDSQFGSFNVNCIIKNNDRVYYRDVNILRTVNIKSQNLFISLMDNKRNPVEYKYINSILKSEGLDISRSIYYLDVINFFKKLLAVLTAIEFTLIFLKLLKSAKASIIQLSELRKSSSYDLTLREFIFKSNSIKTFFRILYKVIILGLLGIAVVVLVVVIVNIKSSYVIDYTSLRSILDAMKSFTSLMRYHILNGFTDMSLTIMNCVIVYSVAVLMILLSNLKQYIIKLFFQREI